MKWFGFILLQIVLIACSNSEQVVTEDSLEDVPADTLVLADSSFEDSLLRDSLFRDSLFKDSLLKDSLYRDSLLKDSLARLDSIAKADSLFRLREVVLVNAKGSTVELGTDSPDARMSERPAMKVKFNYDFYISKHEMSCGEFNALMNSATGLVLDCENDSLPATNVTYYDAVLFANERSKKEGLDTVYTYLSKKMDPEKHCVNLEGFAYHPEVDAYHLPTEAEWVAAAKMNWNAEKSWTADNSGYQLHPVCSKAKDDELCDMMGNAMEWVNDWLGSFRDTTVQNYVGAPDGGSLAQRVVKGGSFRSNASSITLFSRGDVYTVTSSTKSDYVGFRLVLGRVPDAFWMGSNGRAVSSRITPLANASSVYSYLKTYQAKLVFRNDVSGNLAYVDYSSGSLSVVEIVDTLDAYHPDVSPDGSHVAFCTKYEGVEGKSELYVRDLNETGSNLVKLNVESAAIPRWFLLGNGDTVIVYVTDAGSHKDDASFLGSSTWLVKFSNGQFGTPVLVFDGAYHGGITQDGSLAVTGAPILRARSFDHWKTVWYNGEQACNVSVAQDGTKRTLFLDFGSKTGRDFVGKRYSTHQRILIADSTGKLIQSVAAPAGYTFDHTEWVGGMNLAVATLVNSSGSHRKIVLIDLAENSFVDLAEGEEIWHPSLWSFDMTSFIKENSLDLDSAGVYMTESSDMTTWIMKVKMDLFWQYREETELVAIGSSRSFSGVDPELLTSHFAINMAYAAEDMMGTMHFVENYIIPLMPKLKVIVLTLDYDRWYIKAELWNYWFSDIPGYEYDKHHEYWKDGLKGDMYAASRNALSPPDYEYSAFSYNRGLYYSTTVGLNYENPEHSFDSLWFDHDSSGMDFNLLALERILARSRDAGVKVVGVVFPQTPYYSQTGSWGRYGPTRRAAKVMQDAVAALAEKYPHFTVMDEYHDGENDYTSEDFANEDHLGLAGAQKLTERLDALLKTLAE